MLDSPLYLRIDKLMDEQNTVANALLALIGDDLQQPNSGRFVRASPVACKNSDLHHLRPSEENVCFTFRFRHSRPEYMVDADEKGVMCNSADIGAFESVMRRIDADPTVLRNRHRVHPYEALDQYTERRRYVCRSGQTIKLNYSR